MFHGGGMGGGWHGRGGGGGGMMGRFDSDDVLGKAYDSKVIARLPRYLLPVKRWIGMGAVGMFIRTLATMATPYLVGKGTDYIIKGNLHGLNIVVLVSIGVMLFMWLGYNWENLNLSYAGQKIIYRMRTDMFGHLHRLPLSFFDTHQVGKLMSRVQNDVQQLQDIVTQGILALLASLITLIGIAIIMIIMNPRLALFMLAIVPVMIFLVWIWQRYARQAFIQVRRAIATVNSQLQEDLSGVRVVQSLSRENPAHHRQSGNRGRRAKDVARPGK